MVSLGKFVQAGARGKMFGLVSRREVEEKMGRRLSYTVAFIVQAKPVGQLFEAGRIDFLPAQGDYREDLHWHQRQVAILGGSHTPLPSNGDPISAIESQLKTCREWIVSGGFDVDDEFPDDEHHEFVSCCMAELETLMNSDSV